MCFTIFTTDRHFITYIYIYVYSIIYMYIVYIYIYIYIYIILRSEIIKNNFDIDTLQVLTDIT